MNISERIQISLLDSAKYPSQLEVLYNGPEMPYEHDRNGFAKLLIPLSENICIIRFISYSFL